MTGRGPIVLGVDGGNTKTLAVVADAGGRVLGRAQGGATDIHTSTPDKALAELARIAGAALAAAGLTAGALDAAAFSLAGADWPEDFALLDRELRARLGIAAPLIVNDALGALRSGAPDWTGVAIACGTYNAIGARNADGRIFHLGFWPDHTGGHDFGMAAVKAIYRAGLGLGPPTALTAPVLAAYGAADWRALLHGFTRLASPLRLGDVKRLAYTVLDVAEAGDAVAQEIVAGAARLLAGQARVAAAEVGLALDGLTVVLTGGVLQYPSPYFADRIVAGLPGIRPVRSMAPPVTGALLLAFDAAGTAVDAAPLAAALGRPDA
ncbi:MAG: hypothetical protein IT548_01685 [Alphaproteobacteria bacterium]|nr:hypothetical protein [Alphaproteobacteria bacterium]